MQRQSLPFGLRRMVWGIDLVTTNPFPHMKHPQEIIVAHPTNRGLVG